MRLGLHSSSSPILSNAAQLLSAALMVLQLGVEESSQGLDVVDFSLLDILHTAEHVLARFLEFGLVGANLLFDPEVVSSRLGHFANAGIVGQSSVLKLLARSLFFQKLAQLFCIVNK